MPATARSASPGNCALFIAGLEVGTGMDFPMEGRGTAVMVKHATVYQDPAIRALRVTGTRIPYLNTGYVTPFLALPRRNHSILSGENLV
jgi:hypothetical protein